MNLRLLARMLGVITLLIGAAMLFSLPWAHPAWGGRHGIGQEAGFETNGFLGLLASVAICFVLGITLLRSGRDAEPAFFRKEALAVVGLSWVLATLLGALPYLLSGTYRSAGVRLGHTTDRPQVYRFGAWHQQPWKSMPMLSSDQHQLVSALLQAGARGLGEQAFRDLRSPTLADPATTLRQLQQADPLWHDVLLEPDDGTRTDRNHPTDRREAYRIRWVPCTLADALFESQSGFSTTGATVFSDLEDPHLIPHCILFWRSSTHFLGGLGIVVLFVAILGQGSAGKVLMRAEMPGPSKEGTQARMQHTAWLFAAIYCALNLVLTLILRAGGLTWFDALCHAFGTMATGGFSTYNNSLGHFDSESIEYIVVLFMILAGTNFALIAKPKNLFHDSEWRVYLALIFGVTITIVAFSWSSASFDASEGLSALQRLRLGVRYALFQVVSIVTTTGYGTHDFDSWNHFARGLLLSLMFVGGCAGSTGGGMKVIRHVLLVKILRIEIEQSYHPNVVRSLRIGGKATDDPELKKNILVYFSLFLVIYIGSWLLLITMEPDATWGATTEHKLIDSASAIAATLNNIGPGLGTIGATQNYAHFSSSAKLLFTWLMMLGRVEIFAILVLFFPSFWSNH